MRYKPSDSTIVRGATAPFTFQIETQEDLSSWQTTFTLRDSITSTGNPLLSVVSGDSRMSVDEQTIGVALTPTDTYKIPENLDMVYIQLSFEKDGVKTMTWIYSVNVAQTLEKEGT